MSEAIDHCRMSFERYVIQDWGVHDRQLQRRDVMDRDRYADSIIEQMWQTYKAGWLRRERLTLEDMQ